MIQHDNVVETQNKFVLFTIEVSHTTLRIRPRKSSLSTKLLLEICWVIYQEKSYTGDDKQIDLSVFSNRIKRASKNEETFQTIHSLVLRSVTYTK